VGWFGDLLEDTGLSGLLSDGRWVTLKNGKRIKLDADGRIVAGLPSQYHGTHVGDLAKLSHDARELEGIDCEDLRTHCHTCRKTFRTKDEAYSAILEANPELFALQQSESGAYDLAFVKWQRGGRRGPKPRTPITDGRLDSVNEFYNLRGASRVGSFTEAIYHAIPSSRKWADLEPRLEPLAEAAGIKINLPDEALRLSVAKLDVEECAKRVDEQLEALFSKAREGRLAPSPAAAGDAPF
jgi:phage tail protein X